jgi:transcriptional regulator with XRE-family HTH domain
MPQKSRSLVRVLGGKKAVRLYIREWMSHKGMTQTDIMNRLDIGSSGTISKKLAKPETIDQQWLNAIAWALDLEDPLDLYRDPSRPTPDELRREIEALSDQERDSALRVIRALKSS